MTSNNISAILAALSAQVIALTAKNRHLSPEEAAVSWYKSNVYAMLEREESKLWHLSALSLSLLFEQELSGEQIIYPEEV